MSKRTDFVNVAKSQIGVKETGTNNVKYNTWYYGRTVNGRTGTSEYAWCVTFECWCANQVGILNTLVPKCNNVGVLRDWYKARGLYHTSGYKPQAGDLVIFKNASHTGIVESFSNNIVHTIEGNSGDRVARRTYTYGTSNIAGYCQVKFTDNTKNGYTGAFPTLPSRGYFKKWDKGTQVKNLQAFLNWAVGSKLVVDGIIGDKTISAVKKFQKAVGIAQDGLFGKNSLAKAKAYKK